MKDTDEIRNRLIEFEIKWTQCYLDDTLGFNGKIDVEIIFFRIDLTHIFILLLNKIQNLYAEFNSEILEIEKILRFEIE